VNKTGVQTISIAAITGINPTTVPNWNVTIDSSDVAWSEVAVKIIDKNTGESVVFADGGKIETATTAGTDFKTLKLDGTNTYNATASTALTAADIKGVTNDTVTNLATKQIIPGTALDSNAVTVKATGKEAVVITVSGLAAKPATYDVANTTLEVAIKDATGTKGDITEAGDGAKKITVAPSRNGTDLSGNLDLLVYTDSAIAEVAAIKVTVKNGTEVVGTATVDANSTPVANAERIHLVLDKDVDVSTYTVEVEAVNFLKVTGVEVQDAAAKIYVITFDRELKAGVDWKSAITGSNSQTCATANVVGNKIYATLSAEIAATEKLVVAKTSGPVDANDIGLKANAEFTADANGNFS
jgi:hypothetical protein